MNKNEKFPLRYFFLTFIWSWSLWGAVALSLGQTSNLTIESASPLVIIAMVIGAFGPAFGAILSILTIEGKGAIIPFIKRFVDLRFGISAWIVPFLVLSVGTFMAWIIPEFFGLPRLKMLLPSIAIFPVYWLAMVFLGGGQEEIGWRGYIMPFLEKRFGVFYGTVILGLVWAIWHLPLWFIPGSNQTYMNFCGFVMLTTGYSFIFSWGLKKAGNRPMSGLVMHGTANAFVPVFPVMVLNHNVSQPRYWIWVSLMLICGITLYLFSNHNNDSE